MNDLKLKKLKKWKNVQICCFFIEHFSFIFSSKSCVQFLTGFTVVKSECKKGCYTCNRVARWCDRIPKIPKILEGILLENVGIGIL
jgi:hypothetical protein